MLTCLSASVSAQSAKASIGILVDLRSSEKSQPIVNIPIYRNHDGTDQIDIIHFDDPTLPSDSCGEGWCFAWIELQCMVPSIVFFEEKESSLSLFNSRTNLFAWILKKDLQRNGFGFKHYFDLIELDQEESPSTVAHVYYPKVPIYLRKGPGKEFGPIVKMSPLIKAENKPVFEIRPVAKGSGNWLKVTVAHYTQSDCLDTITERKLIKTYEGWVKAVDDNTGSPNIWFDLCCEFL